MKVCFPERPFVVHAPILSSLKLGQRLLCESNNKGDQCLFEVQRLLLMFSRNSLGPTLKGEFVQELK